MMRVYFVLSAIFLLTIPLKAQIVINRVELNLNPGHSTEYRQISGQSALSIFQSAGNSPGGTWDFSSLETTDILKYLYRDDILANDPYQNASYKFNNTYSMADVTLDAREYETAGDNSLIRIGMDLDSSFISMGSFGATLAIRKQKSDYTPALVKMNFPLEYNVSNEFSSNCIRKIYGIANIPGIGVTNAEVIYQVNYSRTFSVSNWGKVKLYASGNAIDVLVFKYKETTIDTVWMNGSLLPDFMLEPLGLRQGAVNTTEGYLFYGKGYGDYLLNIAKVNTQNGSEFYSGYGLSELVTNVEDKNQVSDFSVFPNPTARQFSIRLPLGFKGDLMVRIFNPLGIQVFESGYSNSSPVIPINLSADLPAGTYNVIITDSDNRTVNDRIVISR